MLKACELVFLRQLAAWLSQGLLHDRHEEFFIRRVGQVGAIDGERRLQACSQLPTRCKGA